MSMNFTKLFGSILHSTIWAEKSDIKVLWITMLAMSDQNGHVYASVPGLAKAAGIEIPQCKEGLAKFLAEDEYSRTPDYGGRRIEPIDGGWLLLNYDKYRQIASAEQRKSNNAMYKRNARAREKDGNISTSSNIGTCQQLSAVVHQTYPKSAQEEEDREVDQELDKEENSKKQQPVSQTAAKSGLRASVKKPPKEKKYLHEFNAVKIWIDLYTKNRRLAPVLLKNEIGYLNSLRNAVDEKTFASMARVFLEDMSIENQKNGFSVGLFLRKKDLYRAEASRRVYEDEQQKYREQKLADSNGAHANGNSAQIDPVTAFLAGIQADAKSNGRNTAAQ